MKITLVFKDDRSITKARKRKCKRLIKLRKARDVASKYSKSKLLLSKVFKVVKIDNIDRYLSKRDLAYYILNKELSIVSKRPLRPTIVKP